MRLLLDTQIVILAALAPERLSPALRSALLDVETPRLVSHASLWEIAIKRSIGKLSLSNGDLDEILADLAADELAIRRDHVLQAGDLPLHHRDPFDRLLIAQAMIEDLVLATGDSAFASYPVRLIPAV